LSKAARAPLIRHQPAAFGRQKSALAAGLALEVDLGLSSSGATRTLLAVAGIAGCLGGAEAAPRAGRSFEALFQPVPGGRHFLTACADQKSLPVAEGPALDALRAAYAQHRQGSQEALLVRVTAREIELPSPTGAILTYRVGRVLGAKPDMTCGGRKAPDFSGSGRPPSGLARGGELTGVVWRLHALPGAGALSSRPPHPELAFSEKDGRVFGSDGCNRLIGGYSVSGETLTLTQFSSTMMACAPQNMEISRHFAEVLKQTRRYSVDGRALILIDDKGRVAARFLATPEPK
jgi:heat shock protein HslJ